MARRSPVPDWVPQDLPTEPGVYRFADAHGTTLYVGKSVNLRRRVRGYFYGSGPSDERLAEMLRIASQVCVQRTGSDLEARLEEADCILHERPPYNRALKRRWRGWYIEVRWREPFPRLRIVRAPRRLGASYHGPFWGRRLPTQIVRLAEKLFRLRSCHDPLRPDPGFTPCLQHGLGLCTAPCARLTGLDEYRAQVQEADRLLRDPGYGMELWARWNAGREAAAGELAFERAAELQARLSWLEELENCRFALDGDAASGSWLLVLPGSSGDQRVLQPVARGKALDRLTVEWLDGVWEPAVEDACYAIRVGELGAETVLPPAAVVPAMMIARWVEDGAPGGAAFDMDKHGPSDIIRRLQAAGADALPF